LGETLADGLGLAGLGAVAVAQAAGPQAGVQLGQVADLRHRRRPVALQVPHAVLHTRLLLRPTHPAKQRLESIVTDQGLVALVEAARTAGQQVSRHCLGVVPPQLARHAAEERESLDQAVQDGLGALRR
jgi:hypothetical protein